MLSPHEVAALMLIESAQEHQELNPHDLGALVERQLIRLEQQGGERQRLQITSHGRNILDAIAKRH